MLETHVNGERNGNIVLAGGGYTKGEPEAVTFAPAKSLWEVVNAQSTRKAEFLEQNPAIAEAIDKLCEAGVRFAEIHGVRMDEVKCSAVLTPGGKVIFEFGHPY